MSTDEGRRVQSLTEAELNSKPQGPHGSRLIEILNCADGGHPLTHYTKLNDGSEWRLCLCGHRSTPKKGRK